MVMNMVETFGFSAYLCVNNTVSMDNSIYDTLLCLPLFQGMTKSDFGIVLEKVRFGFHKFAAGQTVAEAGKSCGSFVFLLNGRMRSHRSSTDGLFSLTEEIEAPYMIEVSSMFGMNPVYRGTYVADEECGVLVIEKQFLYTELFKYNVCRMNMMNMLSNRTHSLERDLWNLTPKDMKGRFVHLLMSLSDIPFGRKDVRVKMEDLAPVLQETRLSVSRMLNAMEKEGLVVLKRGGFMVPALEKLIEK